MTKRIIDIFRNQSIVFTLAIAVFASVLQGSQVNTQTRPEQQTSKQRPNILLIIADDMGYSDLGCYGGEIDTPNLDTLAAGGVRFSQFRVAPMCTTTRVALFAGMEYHAAGGQQFTHAVNLASILRDAGYSTSMSGKAHGFTPVIGSRQTDCGFDRYFGHHSGMTNCFRTGKDWFLNGSRFNSDDPNFYSTDAITDYSIRFIKESLAEKKPFFSYIAYNAPHSPIQAPREQVEKYLKRHIYASGWDILRNKRFAHQQAMGLFTQPFGLPAKGVEVPDWSMIPDKPQYSWELNREFEELCIAAYAAMIDLIDQNVGRVLECLRDPDGNGDTSDGVLDNTLIIFLSDNGAAYAGPYKQFSDRPWERNSSGLHMNYGWSLMSNTPFRYYKHSSHEGALRSPLIMHWPSGLTGRPGTILHQSCNIWDFYPTFLELANADYPRDYEGKKLHPLMGESLVPALNGSDLRAGSDLFITSFRRSRGLISGDWKIVSYVDSPWELYNIKDDPVEQLNLRPTCPQQFTRLVDAWDAYFKKTPMVEPWHFQESAQVRGFGYDRCERFGLIASTPGMMEDNVPTDVKLTMQFDGMLDFSNTEGRSIRLQKYGSHEILWQADPDLSNAAQGASHIRFEDFPPLTPGTHYYITWDAGWAKVRHAAGVTSLRAIQETTQAFRFKTRVLP